jgi:hypothetical protein
VDPSILVAVAVHRRAAASADAAVYVPSGLQSKKSWG